MGRSMVEHLISRARAFRYELLLLDVMTERQSAVCLYKSCGFVPTPPYRTYEAFDPDLTTLGLDL